MLLPRAKHDNVHHDGASTWKTIHIRKGYAAVVRMNCANIITNTHITQIKLNQWFVYIYRREKRGFILILFKIRLSTHKATVEFIEYHLSMLVRWYWQSFSIGSVVLPFFFVFSLIFVYFFSFPFLVNVFVWHTLIGAHFEYFQTKELWTYILRLLLSLLLSPFLSPLFFLLISLFASFVSFFSHIIFQRFFSSFTFLSCFKHDDILQRQHRKLLPLHSVDIIQRTFFFCNLCDFSAFLILKEKPNLMSSIKLCLLCSIFKLIFQTKKKRKKNIFFGDIFYRSSTWHTKQEKKRKLIKKKREPEIRTINSF